MHGVMEGEVEGIRALWADVPGPLTACLSFRVGQADEKLTERGITHLCEHLALSHVGMRQYGFNGSTGTTVTSFIVQGEPHEVASHLSDLTSTLRSGRFLERLEHERRILEIEGRTRGNSVVTDHLTWRYGVRSHGLVGWEELGLHRLDRDDVWRWAATHFSYDNAVLWFSTPPPSGLDLQLFEAPRNRSVPGEPLVTLLPAWSHVNGPAAATGLASRSVAAAAATSVIGRRCFDWLRNQSGLSYSPMSDYLRLDGDTALMTVVADGPPEHGAAAAWALWSAVEAIATDGPTQAELAEYKDTARRSEDGVHAALGEMEFRTDSLLHSKEPQDAEELAKEVAALAPEAVRDAAAAVRDTLIVQLPLEAEAPAWNLVSFAQADNPTTFGANAVERRAYIDVENWSGGEALLYSNTVLGLEAIPRSHAVEISPATVVIAYGDGSRAVIDEAGRTLTLRPTAWEMGNQIVSWLDQLIPSERMVTVANRVVAPTGTSFGALRTVAGFGTGSNGQARDPQHLGPIVLDAWVHQQALPPGVPESRRMVPGAFMLGWLAHRALLSQWLEAWIPDTIAAFRQGRIPPSTLYRVAGEQLTTDLVAPQAACFVADMMVPPNETAPSRYDELLTQVASGGSRWSLTEQQHLPAIWALLDADWRTRPRRGSDAIGRLLSPEVPPLPVPPSRCQPVS